MAASKTDPSIPQPHPWPAWDEWPFYHVAPGDIWRNGREAGSFIAGTVRSIPEKCARVQIANEFADGAALAMIDGGLRVWRYSHDEQFVTFCAASGDQVWGAER